MKRRDSRRADSGAITVLATFLLLTLFAMAALAVDVGFLYTRSRMIYAVADAIVAAGMGDIVNGSQASATTDVTNMASQYSGVYTVTSSTTASQLSVTVSATYPMYFGKIFGLASKTISVTAVGQSTAPAPAVLALGNSCTGVGATINGQGGMTVNGNIEGNGLVDFGTGSPNGCGPPPTGGAHITGSALSGCAGGPLKSGTAGQYCWDTVTGTYGTGGPFADPFAPFAVPTCNFGSTSTGGDPTSGHWTVETAVMNKLDPGVYCTTSDLNITGGGAQAVDATGVTFIDIGGTINIGLNYSSTFSAAASSPNGVIAYTTFAGSCSAGAAINLGGPSATSTETLTMLGSLYAPNGCINAGANDATTIVGSFIGNEVNVGDFGAWTIGPGGAAGGNTWQMLQ
jgi:hypothetical protein